MVKVSYSTRLALLFLALPFLLGAEVYRWVDEEGVVHFSERPARNTTAERISVSSGAGIRRAPAPTALAEPTTGTDSLTTKQQALQDQLNQQASTRLREIAKTRGKNCEIAQSRFDDLTQYARIRIRGDDGEYRVLSEEDRVSEINQAKANVVEFCPG
ncbi:MAG: DUF4124 domain-containing protein [Pseudomonadales bacterium]